MAALGEDKLIADDAELHLREDCVYHTFITVYATGYDEICIGDLSYEGCFAVDLVVEGSGIHTVDGNAIPCKANDIYILSPDISHRYSVSDGGEPMVIRRLVMHLDDWFRADAATPGNKHYCYGLFDDGSRISYAMLNSTMMERISLIFDSIEAELVDREREWKSIVRTYLIQLFTFVSRYVNSSVRNLTERSKDCDTVELAAEIIKNEYGNCELSLEYIAKRLYTSTSQLSRSFKLYTGKLFSEYLREVRLNRSAELLVGTDMTVEKIIGDCGLRNIPSYYRNFRDLFGMTPQLYRQVSKLSSENVTLNITNNESEQKKMEILNEISLSVQNGRAKVTKELVERAIAEGASVEEILNVGLLAGMSVVGERFKNNEIYVPEVLVSARAMNMGAQLLKPYLEKSGITSKGKVCIGTVQGDLHDIGKNLVKMMMEGKGLEVIDLGTDVAPETFVNTAIEQGCGVICCSALLTTTMDVMAEVVKCAVEMGVRDKVKIMVGGAPVSEEFAKAIGADCYSCDAASAANAAVELCK